MESFLSSQKYTRVEGIYRDILGLSPKTRTSKQPIGEIPEFEIIPSHPLKYPRSKQGLRGHSAYSSGKAIQNFGSTLQRIPKNDCPSVWD
jgi:hypothetical protein